MIECITFSTAGYAHGNEDVVGAHPHERQSDLWLCALADGMGGRPGGGPAAHIAVQTTLATASQYEARQLLKERTWHDVLRAADAATSADSDAGFTTLVGLCAGEGSVCGASCGDSAALLLQDRATAVLTDRQQKHPPIGSGAVRPVSFRLRVGRAWKLLVMSDGVWRSIGWDTVIEIAKSLDSRELISALHEEALDSGGNRLQDDFSLLLVQSS